MTHITTNSAVADAEIEITPEMIEAGVQVLWESGAVENPLAYADRKTIRRIFSTMFQLRAEEQRVGRISSQDHRKTRQFL